MAGTVGAARGKRGLAAASASFAGGLALGAAVLFGGLGLLGASFDIPRAALLAVVALAVIVDAAALRVRPQVHFQVPERWRRTMPLPQALFLYGALLGTGVSTFVPAAALWALLPLSIAAGLSALVVGLSFAARPALPVIVLAVRGDETALAERPRGLRVLRLLAAGSLVLALVAGAASAATPEAEPAGDPSVPGAAPACVHPAAAAVRR